MKSNILSDFLAKFPNRGINLDVKNAFTET